jgi:hypothetical protein
MGRSTLILFILVVITATLATPSLPFTLPEDESSPTGEFDEIQDFLRQPISLLLSPSGSGPLRNGFGYGRNVAFTGNTPENSHRNYLMKMKRAFWDRSGQGSSGGKERTRVRVPKTQSSSFVEM